MYWLITLITVTKFRIRGYIAIAEVLCVCLQPLATEVQHQVTLWSKTKTKLHDLSPRATYTDRETAACRRSDCQLFADRGCHVVSVTDPYGPYSRFSRQEPLLFYQVAPQLYS
jgi:hypothetical protein